MKGLQRYVRSSCYSNLNSLVFIGEVIARTRPSASDFFATYTQDSEVWSQREPILILSGTRYHLVDTDEIPAGCTGPDVLPDDNGEELKCMMTAGLFGTEILADAKGKNTVRPVLGWWMFEKVAEGEEKRDTRQEILAGVAQDLADAGQVMPASSKKSKKWWSFRGS